MFLIYTGYHGNVSQNMCHTNFLSPQPILSYRGHNNAPLKGGCVLLYLR